MPTLTFMEQQTLSGAGYHQVPLEATDLDGHDQVAIFVSATNVNSGGSTLTVNLVHGPVARQGLMLPLSTAVEIPAGTGLTTMRYSSQFGRFVLAGADFTSSSNPNNMLDLEIVGNPKGRSKLGGSSCALRRTALASTLAILQRPARVLDAT